MDAILWKIITDTLLLIMYRTESLQKMIKLKAPTQIIETEKRVFKGRVAKKIDQLIVEIERHNA